MILDNDAYFGWANASGYINSKFVKVRAITEEDVYGFLEFIPMLSM